MARKEILLEDSVLDNIYEGLEAAEKPIGGHVFNILGWLVILISIVFFGRVVYLDFLSGSLYSSRSSTNAGQQNILKAPRGIIYDRYGTPLLTNEPSFDASINISEFFKNRNQVDEILNKINSIVPFDFELSKKALLSVDIERQAYFSLLKNLTLAQALELKDANINSLVIENNYSRKYIDSQVFAHILGYTGLASENDMKQNSDLGINDEIGKAGLEAQYNNFLTGQNGVSISYQDAKGNVLEEKMVNQPISGDAIHTTIDADLQSFFYNALKNQLTSLGRTAGAGLVMDPSTGEILSMVSVPSFDNNNLTGDLFTNKDKPTYNRVISGIYSPGSTIKPLVGFAALEEKVVDPLYSIYSPGYLDIPNPYFPDKPSRFLDWKPQGWVNLYSAIARSCNVYFYEVGGGFGDLKGLGINRLREYWQKFEIDKKTGIDLPGENSGVLPDPDTKEQRTGSFWRVGDTYNASIGQGDMQITPLELLRYISSIPDRGKLPVPFLAKEIKDSTGKVVYEKNSSFDQISFNDQNNFAEVEKGMLNGVDQSYGTSNALNSIPMTIAAKTGSAQIQNNTKTNAFFVGFNIPKDGEYPNASSDTPKQIAVLVMIEDAKEGSLNAVPIGKQVFQWYLDHRLTTNVQSTSTDQATSTTQ